MNYRYRIIRSARKSIAIQITPAGEVLVRCPNRMRTAQAEQFLRSKESWIRAHLPDKPAQPLSEAEIADLAAQAKEKIPQRAAHFAQQMGASYGRITIRSQRTRWGSCSSKGNLNFNCLLMLAPPEVLDYVVVHELCHRKELNHSPAFWVQVARVMPDYKVHRKWLKENGNALIARLPTK